MVYSKRFGAPVRRTYFGNYDDDNYMQYGMDHDDEVEGVQYGMWPFKRKSKRKRKGKGSRGNGRRSFGMNHDEDDTMSTMYGRRLFKRKSGRKSTRKGGKSTRKSIRKGGKSTRKGIRKGGKSTRKGARGRGRSFFRYPWSNKLRRGSRRGRRSRRKSMYGAPVRRSFYGSRYRFGRMPGLQQIMGNYDKSTVTGYQEYLGMTDAQRMKHIESIPPSLRANFYADVPV